MATKAKAKEAAPAAEKAPEATPAGAQEAYCVKCKAKRPMVDPQPVTMKNGRPSLQSKCPVCGTTLNRILPGK